MVDTILINKKLLTDFSPIRLNTNVDDFYSFVLIQQNIYLKPILGDALFDELIEQIDKNELTPPNSALILKIQPCLAYYTIYEGLAWHWADIANKGVTTENSENSKPLEYKDISQLRTDQKNEAETLQEILIDYLNECKDIYPLWRPKKDCYIHKENTGENKVKYDCGIYFKNKRHDGCECQ